MTAAATVPLDARLQIWARRLASRKAGSLTSSRGRSGCRWAFDSKLSSGEVDRGDPHPLIHVSSLEVGSLARV